MRACTWALSALACAASGLAIADSAAGPSVGVDPDARSAIDTLACNACWTPLQGKVCVLAGRALYLVRPDGGFERLDCATPVMEWSWSPDGQTLFYRRLAPKGHGCRWLKRLQSRHQIRALSLEVGRDRLLVRNGIHPACSPDGRELAFGRLHGVNLQVTMVSTRGGRATNLAPGLSTPHDGPGRWSPDGHWLASVASAAGWPDPFRPRTDRLYAISAEGSSAAPVALYKFRGAHVVPPAWTADGRAIWFLERSPHHYPEELYSLWEARIDPPGVRRLALLRPSGFIWTGRWSPDLSFLATAEDETVRTYHVAREGPSSARFELMGEMRTEGEKLPWIEWSHDARELLVCWGRRVVIVKADDLTQVRQVWPPGP
jgi:dipeptidyl aminopeptidase/acylaminoacyl peptidase